MVGLNCHVFLICNTYYSILNSGYRYIAVRLGE